MSSGWNPFDKGTQKKENLNPEAPPNPPAPPEKTPAELIAESLQTALKPVTDQLGAMASRLEAVETQTKRPPKADPPPNQPDIPSVLDDENVAFAARMTPLMIRQLELEARLVAQDILAEYVKEGFGELIEQYKAEIMTILQGSPVVNQQGQVMRGDPQYIRNTVDMVLGRAAKKAGMKFDGKTKSFFLESAGGDTPPNPEAVGDGLSADQRKVFNHMGVPLSEAKKVLGKLQFIK